MPGFRPRFFVSTQTAPALSGTAAGAGGARLGAAPGAGADLPGATPDTADAYPDGFGAGAESGADLLGTEVTLSDTDSHHALRVLRLAVGDGCEVVVGAAVYAALVVAAVHPVRVKLTARLEGAAAGARYRIQVGLVQALARPAALDYVVEKGTEVGAGFFLLVPASGSPKGSDPSLGGRLARWRRIAEEAAKQSKHVVVPEVEVAGSVVEALTRLGGASGGASHGAPSSAPVAGLSDVGAADRTPSAESPGAALSLVLDPAAAEGLAETLARRRSEVSRASESVTSQAPESVASQPVGAERVALWVGPEGGWSVAERAQFTAAGIAGVRLGRGVLRTETAGPVGVAVARLALGDW